MSNDVWRRGIFRFDRFDTSVGAPYTLFGALPGEDGEQYRKRLRQMWVKDPAARQHLAIFARQHRLGRLAYDGPMAHVAQGIVEALAKRM